MAEGEINIDNIIQRLLEGIHQFQNYNQFCEILMPAEQWQNSNSQFEKMKIFLFLVRGSRPGKTVQMTEAEVRGLCLKSRELFLQQPILLELEAPLKICGMFIVHL